MIIIRAITANWQQKVMAVLIALGIWVSRTNAENPVETFATTVVLKVDADSEFSTNLGGIEKIGATFRGPRRALASLRDGTRVVTATVRLPDPMVEGLHQSDIQFRGVPPEVEVETYGPQSVQVVLTRMARKTVRVVTRLTGTAPAGIYFGDLIYQPQEVEVVGPKDVIDAIDHVRTLVRREDVVNNPTVDTFVRAMDAQGGTIDNPDVTISPPKVTVSVPAEDRTSKSLPVRVTQIGTPAPGYAVTDITVEPANIEVRGLPDALTNYASIEAGPLDIRGRTESFGESVPLVVPGDLSPRNVSSVTVSVTIEKKPAQ